MLDISVVVITNNQIGTIERTLESIFSQKTNFSYEVLVADDASIDGTREVLKKWKRRYSDRMQLYLRKKNVGPTRNAYYPLLHAEGKYIASLEGDDYWSDNHFLQRQVEFLESHSEYIGIQDRCLVVDEQDQAIPDKNGLTGTEFWKFDKSVYTLEDYAMWRMPGHLSAMVYRNIYPEVENRCKVYVQMDKFVGDKTILMLLIVRGDIYCTDKISMHYRLVESADGNNWMSKSRKRNIRFREYRMINRIEVYIQKYYNPIFSMELLKCSKIAAVAIVWMKRPNRENTEVLHRILWYEGCPAKRIRIAYRAILVKLGWSLIGQPEHRVGG